MTQKFIEARETHNADFLKAFRKVHREARKIFDDNRVKAAICSIIDQLRQKEFNKTYVVMLRSSVDFLSSLIAARSAIAARSVRGLEDICRQVSSTISLLTSPESQQFLAITENGEPRVSVQDASDQVVSESKDESESNDESD